jgi:ribonucleoside-diphosphate reductase beta chain
MTARVLQTTSPAGIDRRLLPWRLWEKSKKYGIWDPGSIDFTRDREDWSRLAVDERELLLHLVAMFQAGEESVTLDLLPLILAIAREGRLEEEMFLTAFLWEEAKHVETFRLFLDVVVEEKRDLTACHTPAYRKIFYEELPAALANLLADSSPIAIAKAAVTYNLVVEGMLAETGYRVFALTLEKNGILPGFQQAIGLVRRDESRHLAYGVYLLSRLVAEHGDPVWQAIERRMSDLLEPTLATIAEVFARFPDPPFGLQIDEFTNFAQSQFANRLARIERARRLTLEEIQHGEE